MDPGPADVRIVFCTRTLDSCETLAYAKASGHRAQSSRSSKRQGRWTPSQHHRQARQKAQELYDERRFTMAQIAVVVGVSRASLYRYLEIGCAAELGR